MTRVLILGHSHILTLQAAARKLVLPGIEIEYLLLRDESVLLPARQGMSPEQHRATAASVNGIDREKLAARIAEARADVAFLCLNGNEYTALGLFRTGNLKPEERRRRLTQSINATLVGWLDFLRPLLPAKTWFLAAPPPVSAASLAGQFVTSQLSGMAELPLHPPGFRQIGRAHV